MRVAFYAPMKAPGAPVPSGDRAVGRLLIAALERAGHAVEIASTFASRDAAGDPARQARLRRIGGRLAGRLVRRYRARPAAARPDLWLTYHLYYKAPDWIGPAASEALGIPYVAAEASHAPKRAGGPWDIAHAGTEAAIRRADAIIGLNSHDAACVLPLLARPERLHAVRPFIDVAPFAAAAAERARHRADLVRRLGLDPAAPLLLAVAMMRPGDKLASYETLAAGLARLADEEWSLIVAGDGPARAEVDRLFAPLPAGRIRFLGRLEAGELPAVYAGADIYVWPAIGEAFGIALLEAQAAGLPAVAGDTGGVGDIVRHGKTGLLTAPGDAAALAEAVRTLIRAPGARAALATAAARTAREEHAIEVAADRLDRILRGVLAEHAA